MADRLTLTVTTTQTQATAEIRLDGALVTAQIRWFSNTPWRIATGGVAHNTHWDDDDEALSDVRYHPMTQYQAQARIYVDSDYIYSAIVTADVPGQSEPESDTSILPNSVIRVGPHESYITIASALADLPEDGVIALGPGRTVESGTLPAGVSMIGYGIVSKLEGDWTFDSIASATGFYVVAGSTVTVGTTVYTAYRDILIQELFATSGSRPYGLQAVVSPTPSVIASPYADRAYIAVICDDCRNDLLTVGAGGCGGVTPMAYAAKRGVPVSVVVIPDWVGDIGKLTKAQLTTLILQYGCELINGTYSHTSTIDTDAEAFTEIVGGKKWIEDNLDTVIRGFVQPGSWNGTVGIDSLAKAESAVADIIRQAHEWSNGYLNNGMLTHHQRHFVAYAGLTASQTAARLVNCCLSSPGKGILVGMDAMPSTSGYSFKDLINAIVIARDAGWLQPVSVSGFMDFQAWHSGTRGEYGDIGCVPGGTFDDWTDLPTLGSSDWSYGAWKLNNATSPSVWSLETHGDGKALQFNYDGSHSLYCTFIAAAEPGYSYLLEFDACRVSGTANGFYVDVKYLDPTTWVDAVTDVQNLTLEPVDATAWAAGEWTKYYRVLAGPVGLGSIRVILHLTAASVAQIDNVRLRRI